MTVTHVVDMALSLGIHRGMPASEYHNLPFASNSRLCDLARSPAHCRHAIDNPKEPTDDMKLGTAAHAMILEPAEFGLRFVVAEQCAAKKKSGERCENPGKVFVDDGWLCGVHGKGNQYDNDGTTFITRSDYDKCARMYEAVMAHPAARAIIEAATDREISSVWSCRETGAICKARADIYAADLGLIADLKTTTDSRPAKFMRTISDYSYHCQMAHYADGFAAFGLPVSDLVIIAVEKEEPHGVSCFRLRDDVLDLARVEILRRRRLWKSCVDSGIWPGYSESVVDIGIPQWSMHELESLSDFGTR